MLDPAGPLVYVILGLSLLLGIFFAGSDTAYTMCSRHRMMVLAEDNNRRAKISLFALKNIEYTHIGLLLITNLIYVFMSVVLVGLFYQLLGIWGIVIASLIAIIIIYMFGELIPRRIAQMYYDKWVLNSSLLVLIVVAFLLPLEFIIHLFITLIRKLLKINEEENSFDEDDFQEVIEQVEEEGVLDEEESDIIQAAIDFGDILVSDIFTPKEKVITLDVKKCTPKYIEKFLSQYNYSRIPLYSGSIDNIVGVLHVRTYLKYLFKNKKVKLADVIIPPYVVNPQTKLDDIFNGFITHKTHMAIVMKNNKMLGIVTMKDVLEELVEDIDEIDDGQKEG